MASFPKFSLLPLEIRQKIWRESLPGPRVLHVVRSTKKRQGTYTTTSASYGGRHPSILSVNKESRAEALRLLKPKFGAYWNLEIDAPYFEIKDNAQDAVTQLAEMRRKGLLKGFKNIAIDWMLWDWKMATSTMEFKVTFGNRFAAYEHPIQTLNALPAIENCTFIYTDHTLQPDLTTPYAPWYLGPLDVKNTLSDKEELAERKVRMKKAFEESRGELNREGDIEISFMGICGRERGYLPPESLRRKTEGWEMDWFG